MTFDSLGTYCLKEPKGLDISGSQWRKFRDIILVQNGVENYTHKENKYHTFTGRFNLFWRLVEQIYSIYIRRLVRMCE